MTGADLGDPADDPADDEGTTISWAELAVEVGEALATGPHALDAATAVREGRLIVMRACGADSTEWPSLAADWATKRGVAAIDSMANRRVRGEPLQYVLGEWGFRHLEIYLDARVLIPRPETEVVAGLALAEVERLAADATDPVLVADLGTGSGVIGLALVTEHHAVEAWLTDASADALAVARANTAGIGRPGQRVRLAEGSWFEALPDELAGRFGVIVSNPPYVADDEELPPVVADWEPSDALFAGPSGTEDLDRLVDDAPSWLAPEGALVLEMAPHQTAAVAERAERHFVHVAVETDLTGRERAVVARGPRLSGAARPATN